MTPKTPARDATGRFVSDPSNPPKRPHKKRVRKPKAKQVAGEHVRGTLIVDDPHPTYANPPPKLINHVCFLLDISASMQPYWQETLTALRKNLSEIRGQSIRTGQETTISLFTFGTHTTCISAFIPSDKFTLPEYLRADHCSTRLYGGIVDAVNRLASNPETGCSYLMYVLTDGDDNASGRAHGACEATIRQKQATDRWTFGVLCPSTGVRRCEAIGIPKGNIQPWDQTTKGAEQAGAAVTSSVGHYYATRSTGRNSTQSLFADLSKVTATDLARCADLSDKFRHFKVEKECRMDEFVTEKMGNYILGTGYYALTKPETVQPQKQILIRKRGEKKLYGGTEARQLLGLPSNGDVRLKPGNTGDFEVFIQSQSVNRILVRGFDLLVAK